MKLFHLPLLAALLALPLPSGAALADTAPADSAAARPAPVEVGLDDAVRIGLERSRQLELARLERLMSKEQLTEATAPVLPQLNSGFTYTRAIEPSVMFLPSTFGGGAGAAEGGFQEIEISPDNSARATLELKQALFNAKAFAGIRAAGNVERMSDESYREREAAVVAEIKRSYFDALISREQLQIVRQSIERWQEARKDTQAMFRQGMVADVDTLKAWLSVENLRPDLIQAENRVGITMTRLKNAMGLPLSEQVVLTDTLAAAPGAWPDDLEAAWKEAAAARPDIRRLEYQLKAEKERVSAARAERYPVLTAFGQLESQSAISDDTPLDHSNWPVSSSVGVQVSLPLFTGYATSARVEQAKLSRLQAATRLDELKADVQAELETRLSTLSEARKRIAVQESTIALAKRNYRITLLRFKEGVGSRLELTDAELQLNTSRTNYLKAVYDYLVAGVEMDRALGRGSVDN